LTGKDYFIEFCKQSGMVNTKFKKILSFISPIYNRKWRNISTIYIYNKTSIKRNILTLKENKSGSRSG